jgi:hypothetical protein
MEAALMKRLATLVMITASFGLLLAIGPCALKADDTDQTAQAAVAQISPTNPASATNEKPKAKRHGLSIQIDGSDDSTDSPSAELTANQRFELEKIRAATQGSIPVMAPLIVAIVFGCPVLIVAVLLFYRHRKNVLLHRTLAAMIEKGTPIPPVFLVGDKEKTPRSDLRRGVILACIGLGIAIFFLAQKDEDWGIGMIPFMIGVGYLIVWKINEKKQNGQT